MECKNNQFLLSKVFRLQNNEDLYFHYYLEFYNHSYKTQDLKIIKNMKNYILKSYSLRNRLETIFNLSYFSFISKVKIMETSLYCLIIFIIYLKKLAAICKRI